MKRIFSVILIVLIMLNTSCFAFAKWALVHDGYTTFFDSKSAAENAFTYGDVIYEVPYAYGDTYDEIVDSQEEYEFWCDVADEISYASRGQVVVAYCNEYQNMNVCVMEALSKKNTVSLQIYSDVGDFIIPAGKLLEIEPGRISYPLRQVYLVYTNPSLWVSEEVEQKVEVLPTIEPKKEQEVQKEPQSIVVEEPKAEQQKISEEKEIVYIATENTEADNRDYFLKYKILVVFLVAVIIILVVLLIKSKSSKRKYMTL